MARVKIELPETLHFETRIPIRVTDMNYGGHLGNDATLTLMQEARMQYFRHHGFDETSMFGLTSVVADVAIVYKAEVFYGTTLKVEMGSGDFGRVGFDVFYRISNAETGQLVNLAKTGIVCLNMETKKVTAIPEEVKTRLQGSSTPIK